MEWTLQQGQTGTTTQPENLISQWDREGRGEAAPHHFDRLMFDELFQFLDALLFLPSSTYLHMATDVRCVGFTGAVHPKLSLY